MIEKMDVTTALLNGLRSYVEGIDEFSDAEILEKTLVGLSIDSLTLTQLVLHVENELDQQEIPLDADIDMGITVDALIDEMVRLCT